MIAITNTKKSTINSVDYWVYLCVLGLLLLYQYIILKEFAFKYADSDQSIQWYGLDNYSKGNFKEPRFYGQAYNTMMEAFFAVPLYQLGIAAYKALPIISSLLALFPYVIFSLMVFLKKSPPLGILILCIPLLLPTEYAMMASMPRGLITGIFVSSFGFIAFFYPKSGYWFLLSGLLAVIGYSVNANSVLVAIPYLLFLFLSNYRDKNFYALSATGMVIGCVVHLVVNHFYAMHPFYDFHKAELAYSLKILINSFGKLNLYFNLVSPVFWCAGSLTLVLFLILSILLLKRKDYKGSILIASIPLLLILTFGITKVHDGTDSIFFSCSRMYLSLPLLVAVALFFYSKTLNSKIVYALVLVSMFYFTYHVSTIEKTIQKNVDQKKNHVIAVSEVQKILSDCRYLTAISKKHKAQLLLISSHKNQDFYNFGCAACDEEFPNTLRPAYERRTWRLLEDEKKIYLTILIIDSERDLAAEFDFIKRADNSGYLFILANNKSYTMNLLRDLKIHCRVYK
ncbi:MAG: hypothetical protein V4580_12545 [Bacteroidota bacterium]